MKPEIPDPGVLWKAPKDPHGNPPPGTIQEIGKGKSFGYPCRRTDYDKELLDE